MRTIEAMIAPAAICRAAPRGGRNIQASEVRMSAAAASPIDHGRSPSARCTRPAERSGMRSMLTRTTRTAVPLRMRIVMPMVMARSHGDRIASAVLTHDQRAAADVRGDDRLEQLVRDVRAGQDVFEEAAGDSGQLLAVGGARRGGGWPGVGEPAR